MSAHFLFLDSDDPTLSALEKALEPKAGAWTVAKAKDLEQATACLEAEKPDIIAVNYRYGAGNGLEALKQLVELAPMAHPFILADDEEKEHLAAALSGGCRYLPLDCPPERMLSEFTRCLAIDSWLENPVAKQVLDLKPTLKSPPALYLNLLDTLNSPHSCLDDISSLISRDVALSAKILEVVNTSHYGFGNKIARIPEALSTLGTETVKTLVLGAQFFEQAAQSEHSLLVNELWHHSTSVAAAARLLAQFETGNPNDAEAAYAAGLLHDIGKLALLDCLPDEFAAAQRLARQKNLPAWKTENEIIGCDHAEVGGYLLARWNLPDTICEAAALHHRPANAPSKGFSLLAATHAANAIIRKRKYELHPDANPHQPFLLQIGKANSWDDWEAVALGQPAPSRGPQKLSLKSSQAQTEPLPPPAPATPPPPPQAEPALAPSHERLAEAIERSYQQRFEPPATPKDTSKTVLYSFAGGIIFCLCLVFMLDSPSGDPAVTKAAPGQLSASEPALATRQEVLNKLIDPPPSSQDARPATREEASPPPPPPEPPPPPFPEIKLSAIFQRSTGPQALVNGSIVREGAVIAGATIKEIRKTSILVEHFNRTKELHLD